MKPVDTHESEAIVDASGSVRVDHVPFAAGEHVRILILRDPPVSRRHTAEDVVRSRQIRSGLADSVRHYDRPTDPVAVDEWDALRDADDQPPLP